MISAVEVRRLWAEWSLRFERVRDILNPPAWDEKDWRDFCMLLAGLVRKHGMSWIIDPNMYWDLRWETRGGGELICQLEHYPEQKTTLIVAQTGGFAAEIGSYTWLWAEFDPDGFFTRDPYWIDGTWKEALMTLLTPLQHQAGFYLERQTQTPQYLLLQPGARVNSESIPESPEDEDEAAWGARVEQEPVADSSWRL